MARRRKTDSERKAFIQSLPELFRSGILSCLYPLFVFSLVSTGVLALLDGIRVFWLQDQVMRTAAPGFAYTMLNIWDHLCVILPAGIGLLPVRRLAVREIRLYKGHSLPLSQWRDPAGPVPEPAGLPRGMTEEEEEEKDRNKKTEQTLPVRSLPVLFVSVIFLSLGINLGLSALAGRWGIGVYTNPKPFAGPGGLIAQVLVYVLFMPLIEEMVFRGLVFIRLDRQFGIGPAILFSGLLFGAYHASLLQGVYAFLMGMVFAAAYAVTGQFTVPYGLHGACNLVVLYFQWTGTYRAVCTPAWASVFLAAAAMGAVTMLSILRKNQR